MKTKEKIEVSKKWKITLSGNTNSGIFINIIIIIVFLFSLIGILIKRMIKKGKNTKNLLNIKIDMEKRIKKKTYQ